MGALSAKVWAYFLGPSGYGILGLEQSLLRIATLFAASGIGTALVRTSAQLVASGEVDAAADRQRAATTLACLLAIFAALIFILFRTGIDRMLFDLQVPRWEMAVIGMALACTVIYDVQLGTLNAHHQVKALAAVSMTGAVLGATLGIALIARWREAGIPFAVLALALANCLAAQWWLQQKSLGISAQTRLPSLRSSAFSPLLRFGAPYAASMLAGTGVQLALPFLVLRMLGPENVGFYRAAALITVTYVGFLLTAMAQDYYPRMVAAGGNRPELARLINEQHRITLLLALPIILGMLALVPHIIPILFTPAFMPAATLLEWQLIGDVFKLSSWTMSFAILAQCGSSVFFWTELSGGVALLLASWVGMKLWGLAGIGIAYLVAYIVYYLIVRYALGREVPLRWSKTNRWVLGWALVAVAVVRILPVTPWAQWRTPIALAIACLFLVPALRIVHQGFRLEPTSA